MTAMTPDEITELQYLDSTVERGLSLTPREQSRRAELRAATGERETLQTRARVARYAVQMVELDILKTIRELTPFFGHQMFAETMEPKILALADADAELARAQAALEKVS